LSHIVRLYVPSTIDGDIPHDNQGYVDKVVEDFSVWFGGATAYNALGGWYDGHKVVYESVTIVEAHADNIDLKIPLVIWLAETVKSELRQQAVAIEVDGVLYLV
jgi:hypothetical protein